MDLRIRIPRFLVTAWDAFGDWSNVPVYRRGRLEVRRLDILLAIGFVGCVAWYGITIGWQGALAGGLTYIMFAMIALWVM
jgi:hypothetical protein